MWSKCATLDCDVINEYVFITGIYTLKKPRYVDVVIAWFIIDRMAQTVCVPIPLTGHRTQLKIAMHVETDVLAIQTKSVVELELSVFTKHVNITLNSDLHFQCYVFNFMSASVVFSI